MKLYAENLCEGQKYQYIFKTKGGIRKKNAKLLETSLLKNYGKLSSFDKLATIVFLTNLLPISGWLLYQQGLIMFFCWQQIGAFQLLVFWNKIPKYLGDPKYFRSLFQKTSN